MSYDDPIEQNEPGPAGDEGAAVPADQAPEAPEDARPWVQFSDTGELELNEKSAAPANTPPIPEPPAAPAWQTR